MNKKIFILLLFVATVFAVRAQYHVGDNVKDFSLPNYDGKNVSLANYHNAKGFIVIFTCNPCPYAKAYMNRVKALNEIYSSKGFPVIAINPNDPEASPEDSPEKIIAKAKEDNFSFPYLYDKGQAVTQAFGAQSTPQVFILQKTLSGLNVAYIGAIDNDTEEKNPGRINYVQNAVNALLSGKQPPVTFTKAIGCAVKTKA